MAYNNFQNCTLEEYTETIYSEDCENELRISFGGVELQDADLYCEKLIVTSRITSSSKNAFSLGNFIAKEGEIILHNVDESLIQDPIIIDLGTVVNGQMEYVRQGVFYIQDTPTTDKAKTTIKFRDAAVKFDFGYNAKPLMDEHEGKATLKQLLDDICLQAGISHNITSFPNQDIETGFYDNTIKARTYISYIAEQAGLIAIISRDEELKFISLNNLHVWNIPLDIVEKYELGTSYSVERVVYESGATIFKTSDDQDLNTLFIDGANPYVLRQDQINSIYQLMQGFSIDSVNTGKILGNPAIDSYDLIRVIDTENDNQVLFESLANNVLTYTGVYTNTFDTQIGLEQRKDNVSIRGEATFKKWAKIEIDNINAEINSTVEKVGQLEESIEILNVSLDTNIVVVVVTEDGYPFSTKTYDIPYTVKFLGTETKTEYTYRIEGINSGIVASVDENKAYFEVDIENKIENQDNKFMLVIEYMDRGQRYVTNKTIVISTLSSEVEQNVYIGETAPENTNVMWLDTNTNQLKRYSSEGQWTIVNDFDTDVSSVEANIKNLSTQVQEYIKTGYDEYLLTTDETFDSEKQYFIFQDEKYEEYTGEKTGNPSELGLYEKIHYDGIQNQVNKVSQDMTSRFTQTENSFNAQITTTRTLINNETDGKKYYTYNSETDTYIEYTGPTTGNPQSLHLYEYEKTENVDGTDKTIYKLTEDTTFEIGLQGQIQDIIDYVSFNAEDIIVNPITNQSHQGVVNIGKSTMKIRLRLAADVLFFELDGSQIAYIAADEQGNSKLYIKDASVTNNLDVAKALSIGNFGFTVDNDGSITFGKVK